MRISEWIDRVRKGGRIVRYHTHRLTNRPTNGFHMWSVGVICLRLLRGYDSEIQFLAIRWALVHDVAEYNTGDSPAWIKRAAPELKAILDRLEERTNEELGIAHMDPGNDSCGRRDQRRMVATVIKVADLIDNLLTALDERRHGNVEVDSIFHRGVFQTRARLTPRGYGHPSPWEKEAHELVDSIEGSYADLQGHEAYAELKAAVEAGDDYFAAHGDSCD